MKKLLSFFCLIFTSQVFTQGFSPIKAPDVIAFTNANYMPINESTGRVNVTIPIYTINLDGMKIPISISYDTGGVKVNAPASNIGFNWTLNATGLISKEIRGQEDLYVSGGFNHNAPTGYLYMNYGYLRHLLNFPNDPGHAISQPFRDTQPDLYYVMAPGLNTKFTHKKDGSPFELTNTGTKILSPFRDAYQMFDPYWRFGLKPGFNFKLVPTNGFVYTFEDYGFHYSNNADGIYSGPLLDVNMTLEEFEDAFFGGDYIRINNMPDLFPTIHLSSIKNPISKRSVRYIYEDNNIIENNRHTIGSIDGYGTYTARQLRGDFTVEKTIKKIIFPDGVVNFYYNDNRLDVRAGKILKKIEVLNNYGELIRAAVFEQDYSRSVENCTENHCYRLRLNEIAFLDKDNMIRPGYSFEYNTTKFPKRFSIDQDFTGYYNGASNVIDAQHFPKSYFKAGEGQDSNIPFPFTGYVLNNASANVDKTPNLVYSKAASLEKITYPTGGYTLFDYELHSFNFKNTTVNAGGLRLKKQSLFNMAGILQKEISYDYNLDSGITSGSILNMPKYTKPKELSNPSSPNGTQQRINTKLELTNGAFITYSRVKSYESNNGYTINQYTNAINFPNETPSTYTLYGLFETFPDWIKENIELGYYPEIFKDYTVKRSKLLSSQVFDDQDNLLKSIVNEYEYKSYDAFNISENRIFGMPNFAYTIGNNARYAEFKVTLDSESNLLKKTVTTTYTNTGTFVNKKVNIFSSNLPFIKESQTIVNDSEVRKELIYYPFDSEVSDLPNITVLNNLNILTPIKKEYFSNNELLATSLTTYQDFGATKILPFKESISKEDNALEVKANFNNYDKRGNITEYKKEDGIIVSILWGYDYQYKIAEILNANYNSVLTALNVTDTEYLQTKTNTELETILAILRSNLPNAQVYSYIHLPAIGVLSITDPRGRKNSYEYDSFKRLIRIKDHNGKILTENNYNYKLNPSVTIPNVGALSVIIKKSATPDYVPDPAPNVQYTVLSAMTSGGRSDYSYEWREHGTSTIIGRAYTYTAKVPCNTNKTYTVTVTDLDGTTITETVTVNAPICGDAFYLSPIYGESKINNQNNFWTDIAEGDDFGIFTYQITIVGSTSHLPNPEAIYIPHFNNANTNGILRNNSGIPVTVTLNVKATNIKTGYIVNRTRTVTIQPEFEIPSCFVAGTKIKMADGSEKNIEAVTKGDKVATFNIKNKKIETGEVLNTISPEHIKMIEFSFENGIKNTNTLDHPYYVKNKGWASFNPNLTKRNYNLNVKQLEKGDTVLLYTTKQQQLKPIKLLEYELIDKSQTTYNLDKVSKNHNFFANGILVHNKSNSKN